MQIYGNQLVIYIRYICHCSICCVNCYNSSDPGLCLCREGSNGPDGCLSLQYN